MKRNNIATCKWMGIGAATVVAALVPAWAWAQLVVSEDFTGTTINNSWTAINGACLTAGAASNGSIPSCIGLRYYTTNGDTFQVGGFSGFLGDSSAPSSNASQDPDPVGNGALRLTNGSPNLLTGGSPFLHESGAIVSTAPFNASSGVQITFKTVTYLGNNGGSGGDGADGISFFLLDASQYAAGSGLLGSWGGSLGYSCSNKNNPYTGQVGAYVGLGIDEYGNFLNGGPNGSGGYNDNTATGVAHNGWGSGNYQWNRIGLRGAGNVAYSWLSTNAATAAYYPTTLTPAQQATAVQTTCETGVLWNYTNPSAPVDTGIAVADYAPIPNGSAVLPRGLSIANEAATTRSQATPIYYVLKIDSTGLLSLAYSYGGGSLTQVLTNQSITASNGPLPAQLLFGFAGSTGGSDNVHEILCFQAEPAEQSDASTTVNLPLDKLVTTAQVYLPSYHTNNWWGQLTAQNLTQTGTYTLSVSTAVNWDASCVLTGGACQSMNNTNVLGELPAQRTIVSWNGTNGVPFEWGSLSAAEQNDLDPSAVGSGTSTRLNYLRGDRSDEVPPTGAAGAQIYRDRTSVLGDIIHASPFWVGPPANINYEVTWSDYLYPGAVAAENGGANSYQNFYNTYANRENVVYAGANDGLLHGFRTGSFANGAMVTTTYQNDGWEVVAYVPGQVVESIHSSSAAYDYSAPNYSHIFAVDAPPRGDDLYYQGAWHTWLVGGLGAGGSAIYALDVTDPTQFNEGNAASLVQGEWNSTSLVCNNVPNCGSHLGDTYGTPVIWRYHATNSNGKNMWGMVFGNGFPNAISASISPTFTASIGNRFDAVIGDFFTATIALRTLTVTAGTPPAVGAAISGLNVTAGTTITSITGTCPPYPCTYGLNHRSTVTTPEQMTVATTNMYVSSGSGLAAGQTLLDGPVAGTTIVSQISGVAGGPGVYQVSIAQLLASQTILGTGTVMIVSANGVGLAVGQTITGAGVAPGTTIVSQIDGDPGSIGHYLVSTAQTVSAEQMSNGLTSLNVVGGNGLAVGQTVSGPGIAAGTQISVMGTGTGGPGIYAVNQAQTVALTQMTASSGGGTAGIYVMLVDPDSGAKSFYYLDTGYGPNNDPLGQARYNGIAFTSPVDLDGDNTADYVYAGDLFGNLWRFDLTSNNPSNWHASTFGNATAAPLFSSPATVSAGALVDQPITSKPVVSITGQANGARAVIVNFGTGQEIAMTPISPTSYAPGPQSLYGVWDWDMSNWNTLSHMTLASAGEPQVDALLGGTITPANLTVQTLTEYTVAGGTNVETDTNNPVCWYGTTTCAGPNSMFGWQISLPGTDEQVIYNPSIWQGILQVNTTIPSASTIYSCTVLLPTGWTVLIDPATGGGFSSSPFLDVNGNPMTYGANGIAVSGVQTNGTGSITNISAGGQNFWLTDTSNGTPVTGGEQAVAAVAGHRVTWSQLR